MRSTKSSILKQAALSWDVAGLVAGVDEAGRGPLAGPVVAAAVGGLPVAVADGRSGTLVAGHDPEDWAAALSELLAADPGPLRRAAIAHARGFSWDNTVDALLASYRRALADYGSARRRSAARDLVARRAGRRWAMRRGVRA